MKVLFISPNSPFESVGGVERYVTNLMNFSINQISNKTIIVLPTFKENYVDKYPNLKIYYENSIALTKSLLVTEIRDKARLFSSHISKLVKENNIDIICAENFHLGLPPAFSLHLNMVACLNQIPLVLHIHSFAVTDIQVELVNQLMWNKISGVSKSVTGDCFQKGADIELLSTDYLGVNIQDFNNHNKSNYLKESLELLPENKLILSASRIILGRKNILQEKGFINLIQSFSKLSPRYPSLRLLLAIGKAPENLKTEFDQALKMLKGYISLNNVESKTIVKTFSLEEMPQIYSESDLFVLPSENETFGQVFIEAMASGIPVIGTNVGGIPEIISDSYNGYLVQPNDSSILAQMIEKLINDKVTREKFVKAGIKTVYDKFTSEKQFTKFFNTLEACLAIS